MFQHGGHLTKDLYGFIAGPGGDSAYWQRVANIAPANLLALWRLNETSGTNAADSSDNGYNGTYTGVTLAALTGPDGSPAPSFDGINDLVDIFSAGLASAFDGATGTMFVWVKVSGAGVWVDGTIQSIFVVLADANNFVQVRKLDTDNTLSWRYAAGGTISEVEKSDASETGWFSMAITWDTTADEVKAFYNGNQEGVTLTGLGAFVAPPTSAAIGNNSLGGGYWSGGLMVCALWDAVLTPTQIAAIGVI